MVYFLLEETAHGESIYEYFYFVYHLYLFVTARIVYVLVCF